MTNENESENPQPPIEPVTDTAIPEAALPPTVAYPIFVTFYVGKKPKRDIVYTPFEDIETAQHIQAVEAALMKDWGKEVVLWAWVPLDNQRR